MDGEEITSLDNASSNSPLPKCLIQPEAIRVRGTGNFTLFGLNSKFDDAYPPELTAKVAPEEFKATVGRINEIISKATPSNVRWLVCGCLCCCCTLGCSLWPVVCMSRRTKQAIAKALDWENQRLYHKLGLRWRLTKQRFDDSSLTEFVLLLDFIPKATLHRPD